MHRRLKILGFSLFVVLAVGGLGAQVASAAKLIGSAGAVNVHGSQSGTHEVVFTDNSNLKFTCTTMTVEGAVPAAGTETPVLHPTFTGCTAFGLSVTVNTTGCDYELHIGSLSGSTAPASTDIECGSGAIVLTTLTCILRIPTQQGLVAVALTTGASDVLIDTSLTGITYEVTKDGVGCPLNGTGHRTKMDYTGTTTLTASSGTLKVE